MFNTVSLAPVVPYAVPFASHKDVLDAVNVDTVSIAVEVIWAYLSKWLAVVAILPLVNVSTRVLLS